MAGMFKLWAASSLALVLKPGQARMSASMPSHQWLRWLSYLDAHAEPLLLTSLSPNYGRQKLAMPLPLTIFRYAGRLGIPESGWWLMLGRRSWFRR